MESVEAKLLDAIMIHVAFDGWSPEAFRAALKDTDIDEAVARGIFPRGALDLCVAYHKKGDRDMTAALESANLDEMKIRDKVKFAVQKRLELADREAVRRGTVLFTLPHHAPEGTKLLWGTADAIWTALGDPSRDGNWYSKRAILAGVYSTTVLYWLGDDSFEQTATWEFLDRRIDMVMKIEQAKAKARSNPLTKGFAAGLDGIMGMIKAPNSRADLPGRQS